MTAPREELEDLAVDFLEKRARWLQDERPTTAVTVEALDVGEDLAYSVQGYLAEEELRKRDRWKPLLEDLAPLFRYAVVLPWPRVYARVLLMGVAQAGGVVSGVLLARWLGVL